MSGSDRKRKSRKKNGGEDKGMGAKFQMFAEGIEERSSVAKSLVKTTWGVSDKDAGHCSDVVGSTPDGMLALASGSGKQVRTQGSMPQSVPTAHPRRPGNLGSHTS